MFISATSVESHISNETHQQPAIPATLSSSIGEFVRPENCGMIDSIFLNDPIRPDTGNWHLAIELIWHTTIAGHIFKNSV